MSFNRLNYDTCSYKQVLAESIGPGEYQLGKPDVSCKPCFNKDPDIDSSVMVPVFKVA